MDAVALVVVFVLLLAAAVFISAPVRAGRRSADDPIEAERDELEAAKEAKYRELRDAELDVRTGKLSDEDFRALDRTLRAEAVEILRRLDELAS